MNDRPSMRSINSKTSPETPQRKYWSLSGVDSADSRYPEANSAVSVCITANCVLQKRKPSTPHTSRLAAKDSHCHELLADKNHTRAHMGLQRMNKLTPLHE